MDKLTVERLHTLKSEVHHRLNAGGKPRTRLLVCGGTGCHATGATALFARLKSSIDSHGLGDKVDIVHSGCNGFCSVGPIMMVHPDGTFYQQIKASDVEDIVEKHVVKGEVVDRLLYKKLDSNESVRFINQIPFFAKQQLVVLRNCGITDAESLDEYIAHDGYFAAARALLEMIPDAVIEQVKKSGLRGRGGGGFPTGTKWAFARKTKGDIKFILCNADEGDPGAFMDRSILEADPHAVLEGMIIAGYAIGASQGYIYCRAEYPLAIKCLHRAIEQAKASGLLGDNILGSNYSLEIEVYQGAGAFVCGEETALMNSIEGKRGMPRPRPPFPAVSGLWGKPSVLNNVETFANVPQIVLKGGDWYASIGTEKSKGTKVFALTGAVNNVGLVEVPMGTSIGDIIFDIGGGIKKGRHFKAAQLGGPSGGCIPAEKLNTPTDYEEIAKQGAIMGSGGLIVMDDNTCMVDTARFFMEFCVEESCGKCAPCREGTKRMLEILRRICRGQGREGDIEMLEELATIIKDSSLCGLGQTAPNPVLSTIRFFRHEYESHIRDKKCHAAVCSELFKAPCQHACPVGMDVPAYMSLVKANRLTEAMILMKRTNPFLGVCGRVCPQFCTDRCRRAQLDEPMAIAWLKRYVADYAKRPLIKRRPVTRKEKIAVIGAGPAGLTVAQDLCMRGYAVTVFEELPQAGGMLRYAIPEYRMPRHIVDQEVDDIAQMGVEIRTGVRVGRDISFDDLKRDYRVTVIAVGANKNWTLGIPGEELQGMWSAVDFLREHNLGKKLPIGPRVGVIGGGNSAIDAARVAIRMGATDVTVYYRRERKDMPAFAQEIHAAETEGIKFEYLVAPIRLEGSDGKLTSMTCQRMRLGEFDPTGRRKPIPIEGATFKVDVNSVVAAISQSSDLTFLTEASKVEIGKGGAIKSFGTRTTADGVFVAGDVCLGPATVVEAIAFAQKTAIDIDRFIRKANGEPAYVMPREEVIQVPQDLAEEVIETPRTPMPELPLLDRLRGFQEVELGYSPELAMREASRCLRCDVKL